MAVWERRESVAVDAEAMEVGSTGQGLESGEECKRKRRRGSMGRRVRMRRDWNLKGSGMEKRLGGWARGGAVVAGGGLAGNQYGLGALCK